MERFALIGVSHRRGGAAALEAWQHTFDADTLGALGFRERVTLSTCNRWDLLTVLPEGLSVEEARRRLTPAGQTARPYAYVGEGALEQLTRVAASLDSLNPGEDQIMAQVRAAFAEAQEAATVGPTLSFAFRAALRIAKRVRREVPLAPLHTSLFSLARPQLEQVLPPSSVVAVLGAGEMGALAARALAGLAGVRLLVVNRSPERGRQLAEELGAESLALGDFLGLPPRVQALVCATPVAGLVDGALLDKLGPPRLVVDLGVPRNLHPGAAEGRGVDVLDVDSLQRAGSARREALSGRLAEAEGIVREELDLAMAEWTERQLGPSIKRLRDWYLATIGDALPAEEAARLAHKFAHVPVKGLRAVAREHGLEAARTFLAETGLSE
ncbi:MAG TPA: glutamyl-tRNA reductase [Trueperaceae bacterium]